MTARRIAIVLGLAALAIPANAQAQAQNDPQNRQARYAACLAHDAEGAPAAFAMARAWEIEGGGALARHCIAIALLRMGELEEAALRLEALTEDAHFAAPEEQAELLRQSASVWLLAGETAQAEAAVTRAITAAVAAGADDPGLFVLRARIRLDTRNDSGAEADLGEALARAPDDPAQQAEALMLRAQARLGLGRLSAALEDAEAAARADPQSVEARLILGDVREAIRTSGARQ